MYLCNALELVKYVTLEAQVHKCNCKEREGKDDWTSAGRVLAY